MNHGNASIPNALPDASPEPAVAYVDNHLLAVAKPAGTPSQPDDSGDPSMADIAKDWVRREFRKPGNVYLALLHRLDRPVSGALLLARTEKAAARMAALFRERRMTKRYLAVAECFSEPENDARLEGFLAPGPGGGMRAAASPEQSGARAARLRYRTLGRSRDGRFALLSIILETGVKHQIRAQLANAGLPVAGDFRYGAFGGPARPEPVLGGRAILLHSAALEFDHPVGKGPIRIEVPPPDHWRPRLDDFSSLPEHPAGPAAGTA